MFISTMCLIRDIYTFWTQSKAWKLQLPTSTRTHSRVWVLGWQVKKKQLGKLINFSNLDCKMWCNHAHLKHPLGTERVWARLPQSSNSGSPRVLVMQKNVSGRDTIFGWGKWGVHGHLLCTYIAIDSLNAPITQIVRKVCMFKLWMSSSFSYKKKCLGTETIFLG